MTNEPDGKIPSSRYRWSIRPRPLQSQGLRCRNSSDLLTNLTGCGNCWFGSVFAMLHERGVHRPRRSESAGTPHRTTRFAARGFPGPRPASGIVGPWRRLFSQFLECFAVSLVRGALRSLELLTPFGLLGGRDDEPVPVRGEVERRIGIDLQEIENRPVDHQCQTVAVLRESLDHGSLVYPL